MTDIIRIPINQYIHVRDNLSGVSFMVEGPFTYILKCQETLIKNLTKHVQLAKNQYCIIYNPVSRNENKELNFEDFGEQVKLRWGEEEVRTDRHFPSTFPLYPGEELKIKVSNSINVSANEEIKLQAVRPFFDTIKNKDRVPGDTWMIRGQFNYIPRVECVILETIQAFIIKPNCAIKLKAVQNCTDIYGEKRITGQEWLIRESGSYLPNVEERVVNKNVQGITITDKIALHLKARVSFKDVYGKERKAGEEWLITINESDLHIVDVNEDLIKKIDIIVLSGREYCNIKNPVIDGVQQFGKRIQKRGEDSFFLLPGEELENNKTYDVEVLDENDALLLKANEDYVDGKDGNSVTRKAGYRWMIRGPCEFILPLELTLLEKRRAIPLDDNEGIYVRDIFNGEIKMISGQTYLLKASEELWNKECSPEVETLLAQQKQGVGFNNAEVDEKGNLQYKKIDISNSTRDKTRVITYRAPPNSAVQVFDFKAKVDRIVFGPEMIKLSPHEEFTVLRLSGKKPKKENQITNLAALLGPDFMSDIIEVETRDHARLKLSLSYFWKFEFDAKDMDDCRKIFTVNDFIGDACKNLAAKIRGDVSTVAFEQFHKNSANIVKHAVFGRNEDGTTRQSFKFSSNNLVISNVDIQSQEPCDQKTRENLSKSTNLSIQSINQMQQADADQKQKISTEESKGKLKIQKLTDDTHAEQQNIELLKKKVLADAVKTSGDLTARAHAVAKGNEIEGKSSIQQATLEVQAKEIEEMSQLIEEEENITEDIRRREQILDIENEKARKMKDIEVEEFKRTVDAIGKETIIEMARAGPELQANLLKSLGIKSFLVSDGKNPINLFNTANGLINPNAK